MGMKDRLGKAVKQAQDATKQLGDKAVERTSGAVESARDATVARTEALKDATVSRTEAAKDAASARTDAAKQATVARAEAAKGTAVGGVRSLADNVRQSAEALRAAVDDGDVGEILRRIPLPASPVTEPWQWSLGRLVTAGEQPPRGTGPLLKQLDRFGTIDIGPKEVGFDDTTAKWGKVKALRTRTLDGIVERLVADTIVDDVKRYLPPVPGRSWVAGKSVSALLTLWAMVNQMVIDDPEVGKREVVCEIEYKGWIRTKEAETGYFTGPAMALLPGLDEVFRAEAARHGIPIEAAPSTSVENAAQRAAWLRDKQRLVLERRAEARKELYY